MAHGRRNAHKAFVLVGHVTQPLAKHLGKGLFGGRRRRGEAHVGIEFARAVVGHRVGLGQLVALALLGHHMQELGTLQAFDVFQRGNERIKVMPVDRTNVVEAKLFEQRGRHHHALGLLFQALGQFQQRGCILEHALAHVLGRRVELAAHELRQVAVERAHGRADAHVVVVQDDQQVAVGHARVVQRFESHAGRHGAIANDGHRAPVFTLVPGGQRHAQRGRNTGARMGGTEGVVGAFGALRKSRNAPHTSRS